VLVDGTRYATVIFNSFETHVFKGDVSVLFADGTRGLIASHRLRRAATTESSADRR
jgi:hypothetical protein